MSNTITHGSFLRQYIVVENILTLNVLFSHFISYFRSHVKVKYSIVRTQDPLEPANRTHSCVQSVQQGDTKIYLYTS